MKVRFVGLVIVFSLVGACGQSNATTLIPASPTVFPTNTASSLQSDTPVPTILSSPTPTQFPPLSGEPPYLILRQDYYAQEFIIYDHDGKGKKIAKLPEDGHLLGVTPMLSERISSDGQWLVFYTGSLKDADYEEVLPVSIEILNLYSGEIIKIADVVTDATLVRYPEMMYQAAWSPDGHSLAFAGLIDGVSSDVYLFNLESGSVQRVNDDAQDVAGIGWSPDGEYIILANIVSSDIYTTTSTHFMKPSDKTIKTPPTLWKQTWGGIAGWLSPTLLLMTGGTDTAGLANLDFLNISTGSVKSVWDDLYGATAIDHHNQVIAMSTTDFAPPENPGIYFIDFSGNKKLVFDGYYYNLIFRGGTRDRFLALKYSMPEGPHLLALSLDGTSSELKYFENYETSISPNYYWLLLYGRDSMVLYNEDDSLVRSLDISDVASITWRPDSEGIFYSTGKKLYYLELPDGEPVFIDQCEITDCFFNVDASSAWLP